MKRNLLISFMTLFLLPHVCFSQVPREAEAKKLDLEASRLVRLEEYKQAQGPFIPGPAACAAIEQEVKSLLGYIKFLQEELRSAPPSVKPLFVKLLRETIKEFGIKREELRQCLRDNLPNLPDLVPHTVTIQVNHTQRTICVAAVIHNRGGADVDGPFKVAIGIGVKKAGVYIYSEEIFEVPEEVIIEGEGGVYITECSQRELIYRDQDPGAEYDINILVDVEHIIGELNEGNNYFSTKWWTISPTAAKKPTPFKIQSKVDLKKEQTLKR